MDGTLAAAAEAFRERPRRGATAETTAAESRELTKFVAALGGMTPLAQLTPGQIEDYQRRFIPRARADEDMAKAIRNNRLAVEHLRVVQTFLRWLGTHGHASPDLAKALRVPPKREAVEKGIIRDLTLRIRDNPHYFYTPRVDSPAPVRLGIDFGTSNTSVALFDGQRVRLLPIDPANYSPQTCRSLLYLKRAGGRMIGKGALQQLFADNSDMRPRRWIRQPVGDYEFIGSEMFYVATHYLEVDADEPGRFFESLKTGLRTKATVQTLLLDTMPPKGTPPTGMMFSVEDLIGEFLAEVKERAEVEVGGRVDEIYLGRPVHFSTDPEVDTAAAAHLQKAAAAAGFTRVFLQYEPVAAALDYDLRLARPQTVLVFDFGGGTLDVTVMRIGGGIAPEILSLDGVPVGGDNLDFRIMQGKLLKYFGQGVTIGEKHLEFPRHLLDRITRWQTIRELNNPQTREFLRDAEYGASNPRAIRALQCLINNELSLALYEEIERAKIELSTKDEARIRMFNRDIAINERITRPEFESLIHDEVQAIAACVDRAVAAAGLTPGDIDVVLRTGGSSSIPIFLRLLEDRFGPAKIRKQDVFTGIAAGLGIAAWRSVQGVDDPRLLAKAG
jgi:hypothetical chaperone protein